MVSQCCLQYGERNTHCKLLHLLQAYRASDTLRLGQDPIKPLHSSCNILSNSGPILPIP